MGLKLGDISPVAAAVTGKGALAPLSIPGQIMKARNERKEAEREAAAAEEAKAKAASERNIAEFKTNMGFKAGGSVKGWGKARGGKRCKVY